MSVLVDKLERLEWLLKHMPGRHPQSRHAGSRERAGYDYLGGVHKLSSGEGVLRGKRSWQGPVSSHYTSPESLDAVIEWADTKEIIGMHVRGADSLAFADLSGASHDQLARSVLRGSGESTPEGLLVGASDMVDDSVRFVVYADRGAAPQIAFWESFAGIPLTDDFDKTKAWDNMYDTMDKLHAMGVPSDTLVMVHSYGSEDEELAFRTTLKERLSNYRVAYNYAQ